MKQTTILSALAIFLLASCKKNLPEVGATVAQKMANEWWVTLDQPGQPDVFGIGHFKIATYNTAANKDSIWIDDFQNGWQVKFKAAADFNALTFSTKDAPNEYYPITVTLTEGKILLNSGHSKSGNVVDSIHMKLEFSDDPGNIYEMNGGARTRFAEDDY
jgi:Lipid-binding putative hydrolase